MSLNVLMATLYVSMLRQREDFTLTSRINTPAYFCEKILQQPRSYLGPPLISFLTFLEELCKKVDEICKKVELSKYK